MGILSVQFAKLRGAAKVILVGRKSDARRLEVGKKVGADHVLVYEDGAKEKILELTNGIGANLVSDCAGTQEGTQLAIDCVKHCKEGPGGKGRIAAVAMWGKPITLNMDAVSMGQISISGGWSWNGHETWRRAIDMLARNCFSVDDIITSRYELNEWEKAFDNLSSGYDVKALIHPNGRNPDDFKI